MTFEEAIKKLKEDAKKKSEKVQVWRNGILAGIVSRKEAEEMVKEGLWRWEGTYRIENIENEEVRK